MSPNEFQLRAALREGEGDAPDADLLLAHAVGVRRDRRRRINAIVGGVGAAVVVGAGATTIALSGHSSGSGSSAAQRNNAQAPAAAAAGGGGSAAGGSSAGSATAAAGADARPSSASSSQASASSRVAGGATPSATSCPARPDRLMMPGGGGSGQFGATGPLVDGTVTSLRLCGYPLRASARPTGAVVDGAAARAIIAALESAPAARTGGNACPANTDYVGGTVELLATTASGPVDKPVVITLGCVTSVATNGTATRYVTDLPEPLLQLITQPSLKSTAANVPGRITHSPVR